LRLVKNGDRIQELGKKRAEDLKYVGGWRSGPTGLEVGGKGDTRH
jgi:hypothetical protein